MAYNHLMNAKCLDGFKRTKWAKLGRTMASQSSNAIDELGRIFTWGQNTSCESGQGDPTGKPELEDIECASQLGPARDWIKSCSGEETTIALNKSSELWGWGNGYYDCAPFGLPPGSGSGPSSARFCNPVRVAPGYLFKDVAHDYYHTLAIGKDNDKLYTFGSNLEYSLGAGVTYGDNFYVPILNPYLTSDIKFIDCEQLCSVAVTTDDRVYVWGIWWYNQASWSFDSQIPLEITGLTIPSGETISQCQACPNGVVVLLSNGEVWAAGHSRLFGDQQVAYPTGTQTFEQVIELSAKTIIKVSVTALGATSFFVIDSNGNIWGFSDDPDWYTGSTLVPTSDTWNLIAAEFEDEHRYIDVINNTHNKTYQAINIYGYLFTWGLQSWGTHLALCAKGYASDPDPYIEDIVYLREIVGLATPALDYQGDLTTLNTLPLGESEYLQPLPQMLRHRPCGHWHLRLFEGEGEELWPRNCWMPSVSIYENHLMFVACGKHLQTGIDTGCEVMIFDYDIDANIWTLAFYGNAINAASAPGGASIYDDTMVFANWKADASGTGWYDVHYTNFCLGVWVLDGSYNMNYVEFASKNDMYMQGKVAAYSGGLVAVAYENVAGQLLVQVSTDYGATWNLRKTVGALAVRKDYSLAIDKNGYIFLAHQVSTSAVMVERTIDNGLNWTTRIASNYMIANMEELKLVADNDMLFLFASSSTASAIERSSNGGTSWFTISGEPLADPHVSSGCNVSDDHNDIAFVTSGEDLNNYLYDTDYGGYNWLIRSIPQISEEGDEINTYRGPNLADLNGYNGRFAYSAYTFYSIPVPYVAVAITVDKGVTWAVRSSPLGWASGVNDLGDFRGCPLFCLTDVPHLNHIWKFEKSDWATKFVKQKDKYKVEQPCVCPQYRGV